MKKVCSVLLLLLVLAALLCGCAAPQPTADAAEGLRIVATIFPPFDFARQLAGPDASVTMLTPPGSESHDFVPSLTDLNTLAQCDLFLCVGGETDRWVTNALESLGDAAPKTVALLDLVKPVEEELLEGMEPEESDEAEWDEHVWTSPRNAAAICEGISAALEEIDPGHKADHAQRLADYLTQLDELDTAFREVMDGAQRRTVVFAERFPFRYLADELGLECYAAFPGCSSDTEPSLATIAFLTEKVQQEQLPVVFCIEFSTETVADTICTATGAEKRLLHSCHNVTQAELDAGISYLDLMRQNVESLRAALQ